MTYTDKIILAHTIGNEFIERLEKRPKCKTAVFELRKIMWRYQLEAERAGVNLPEPVKIKGNRTMRDFFIFCGIIFLCICALWIGA